MSEYTEHESDTIRAGVLGAISLVSRADPGFFALFKESAAGAKALEALPEDLRRIVSEFDLPTHLRGEELNRLSEGLSMVDAKDPEAGAALRTVVLDACQQVADAAGGVADSEKAVIDQVRLVVIKSAPLEDTSGIIQVKADTTLEG